ncbi:hypothetical protein CVT24_006520, partial [Panaeolus cyanescens]
VALAPPGTEACTLDIEKFHRTCPALPEHKPWLVVQGRPGDFYIDHCLPFGAACASSNAGMIANALVDIWIEKGFRPVLKYEDDIQVFRLPSSRRISSMESTPYSYDFAEVVLSVLDLGVPWHPTKGTTSFTSKPTFLGLLWDLPARTVALPEEKRIKFIRSSPYTRAGTLSRAGSNSAQPNPPASVFRPVAPQATANPAHSTAGSIPSYASPYMQNRARRVDGSETVDSVCIHLPWTKTTKDQGGKIILTRRGDNLCPVFAILNHFSLNHFSNISKDSLHDYSLFAYMQDDGHIRNMYKIEFLNFVQGVWKSHPDLSHVSGHSFRIGGAVALLMAGVEPEVVAAAGGWTSMSFLLYWRKLDHIIPQFTAKAYAGKDISSITSKIERMGGNGSLPPSVLAAAASF